MLASHRRCNGRRKPYRPTSGVARFTLSAMRSRHRSTAPPATRRAAARSSSTGRSGSACSATPGPFPEERFQGNLAPDLRGAGSRWSAAQLRLRIVDTQPPQARHDHAVLLSQSIGLRRVGASLAGQARAHAHNRSRTSLLSWRRSVTRLDREVTDDRESFAGATRRQLLLAGAGSHRSRCCGRRARHAPTHGERDPRVRRQGERPVRARSSSTFRRWSRTATRRRSPSTVDSPMTPTDHVDGDRAVQREATRSPTSRCFMLGPRAGRGAGLDAHAPGDRRRSSRRSRRISDGTFWSRQRGRDRHAGRLHRGLGVDGRAP